MAVGDGDALAQLRDDFPAGWNIRHERGQWVADVPYRGRIEEATSEALRRRLSTARYGLAYPRR